VTRRFGARARYAGLDEFLNVEAELRPSVFASDEFERLILAEMTSRDVIVLFLEDSES